MATVVFLDQYSTSPWTKPGDFTDGNNSVEGIGEGGGDTSTGPHGGCGGGAYAKSTNLTLSGDPAFIIGTGGTNTATQFRDGSTLVADYGRTSSGDAGASGGLSSNCVKTGAGAVAYSGGNGGTRSGANFGGGGGGGAAGPHGAGSNGGNFSGGSYGAGGGGNGGGSSTAGSDGTTGVGGTSEDGTAGGGPDTDGSNGSGGGGESVLGHGGTGGAGIDFDASHGSGGGAGGGSPGQFGDAGGDGGWYGGGAGGSSLGGALGSGAPGLIVITYPLTTSVFIATRNLNINQAVNRASTY